MSKPDTNQASEDALDLRTWLKESGWLWHESHIVTPECLNDMQAAIQSAIRTEKLKLLAEVRERVIGEDVELNSFEIPIFEEDFVITSVTQQNHLRADQRISLAKLEADQ